MRSAANKAKPQHADSDAEILMMATVLYPDDASFAGASAARFKAEISRNLPKDRKVIVAQWRNGITVVLGFPTSQQYPTPEALVNAYHEATAMRALANLAGVK